MINDKLMEPWVRVFANNVLENNRKQTVNKIYPKYPYCVFLRVFAFCVVWLVVLQLPVKNTYTRKSVNCRFLQLIVDNWTTLWHTSSIVYFVFVARLLGSHWYWCEFKQFLWHFLVALSRKRRPKTIATNHVNIWCVRARLCEFEKGRYCRTITTTTTTIHIYRNL